jgi:cullin 1
VLPSLRDHHDEFLLKEVKRRWENHKIMNEWMRKFFMYLVSCPLGRAMIRMSECMTGDRLPCLGVMWQDRYYVKHNSLPKLYDSGIKFFKELVYDVVKSDVVASMLAMINQEREGHIIDRELIKSCVEIFETMGESKECYKEDFEEQLLSATQQYYAVKSQVRAHQPPRCPVGIIMCKRSPSIKPPVWLLLAKSLSISCILFLSTFAAVS